MMMMLVMIKLLTTMMLKAEYHVDGNDVEGDDNYVECDDHVDDNDVECVDHVDDNNDVEG